MAEARPVPSPRSPWSEQLFTRARVSPLLAGAGLVVALLLVLIVVETWAGELGRLLRGQADEAKIEEYRFAVVIVLLLGYLPAAWAYAVQGSRRTIEALRPAIDCGEGEYAALHAQAGRFDPARLRRDGIIGVVVAVLLPFVTDLSLNVYDPGNLNTTALAHRIMLPFVGWWAGRFLHAVLADSSRLARLGREQVRVDLLDLSPLRPFARHGLRSSLQVIGLISIAALLVVDFDARPGLPLIVTTVLLAATIVATVVLILPVRGAHAAIRTAKERELAWANQEIRSRREALAATPGATEPLAGLADLASYRSLIAGVHEWPFDTPILTRFALYLAIPLGSWVAGALVERMVDAALS